MEHPCTKVTAADFEQVLTEMSDASGKAIARELHKRYGISVRTAEIRVAKYRNAGAHLPRPQGFQVTKTTEYRTGDGELRGQWIRSEPEKDAFFKVAKEYLQSLLKDVKPAAPRKPPKGTLARRLANYNVGDPHIGMLAWAEETGEDFDLRVAERDLVAALAEAVEQAPATQIARLNQFGDFYHIDNTSNQTWASSNVLDADSRFHKIVRVGIRTMRVLIEHALQKHETVIVRNCQGNHDPHSALILTYALWGIYQDEPRVQVETNAQDLHVVEFGKNLIGLTHGHHIKKPEDMVAFVAAQHPEAWGRTAFRYIWHGHIHHRRVQECAGATVESFRSLAGQDAWHVHSGYKAMRDLQCVILDKEDGEVSRNTVSLTRARRRQQEAA